MPRLPIPDTQTVSMSDAIGGPRGIIDSSLPTVAFVAVNAELGLTSGIVVAALTAAALVVLRLVRREPVQQAFSGLFAVALAAFVVSRTGEARDYFLLSIARNAFGMVVALASVGLRRPIGGYLMAGLDARYHGWRDDPRQRRAAVYATLVWASVFALRFCVQGIFWLADRTGWLAVTNIVLGLPLFGVAVVVCIALVRRLAPLPPAPPRSDATVVDGTVVDGTTEEGAVVDGAVVKGSAAGGVPADGGVVDGRAVDGVHRDPSTANGSGVNGTGASSSEVSSSGTNGCGVNGSGANGSVTNGWTPEPDRFRLG